MRVIKENHNDKLLEYKLVCWNCESILGVTKDDVEGNYYEEVILCPICGSYNKFDPTDLEVIGVIDPN